MEDYAYAIKGKAIDGYLVGSTVIFDAYYFTNQPTFFSYALKVSKHIGFIIVTIVITII